LTLKRAPWIPESISYRTRDPGRSRGTSNRPPGHGNRDNGARPFYNVPRGESFRSNDTELGTSRGYDAIRLAHPEIRFTLESEGGPLTHPRRQPQGAGLPGFRRRLP
jgi:hypothetical protein